MAVNPVAITLGAALLLAALTALALLRLRTVFIVRLSDADAQRVAGHTPPGFLDGCSAVARRHGIRKGRITAVRDGTGIRLRFSRGIPSRSHQAFRNLLTPSPGGGPSGGGRRAAG